MNRCKIRIVNHVTEKTTSVETGRSWQSVFIDLAKIVRGMNRQKFAALSGSLSATPDELVLHIHCARPAWDNDFTADIIAVSDPIREIERAIWQIGGVA